MSLLAILRFALHERRITNQHGERILILQIDVYREAMLEEILGEDMHANAARVIGDTRIVGAVGDALRHIKAEDRVKLTIHRGCDRNRIRVEQVAPLDGEMLLTGSNVSNRLKKALRNALDGGFVHVPGSAGQHQPKDSYTFTCRPPDRRTSPPKPPQESAGYRPRASASQRRGGHHRR